MKCPACGRRAAPPPTELTVRTTRLISRKPVLWTSHRDKRIRLSCLRDAETRLFVLRFNGHFDGIGWEKDVARLDRSRPK
jgi:hypothetical protein